MLSSFLNPWSSMVIPPWNDELFRCMAVTIPGHEGGKFLSDRYDAPDGSLCYKLFVPSHYAGAPMPLVVMMHGCGQDADDFALGTGMNELAERHGFLVAYPEQSCAASWNKCWHWFDAAHHERDQGEPALIAGVIQKVCAEYAVDRGRVFAAGLSSGGAMAVILGRTYPDLIAAIGCHSGLAHGSATDSYAALQAMRDGADPGVLAKTRPVPSVPIIVFHGDRDSTVHLNNGLDVVRQTIEGFKAHAPLHSRKLLVSKETGEIAGRPFTRHIHRGKTGKVLAERWTIHGSGHAWSGGNRRGSYTDTCGPCASAEMVRFFMQGARP